MGQRKKFELSAKVPDQRIGTQAGLLVAGRGQKVCRHAGIIEGRTVGKIQPFFFQQEAGFFKKPFLFCALQIEQQNSCVKIVGGDDPAALGIPYST